MPRPAQPGEINYAALDGWTFVHGVWGAVLGHAGVDFLPSLLTSVLWENAEPVLKRRYPEFFPSASIDTTANKVADTAAWMVGWWWGSRS